MRKVEVFGTGCPNCRKTEEIIRQAAASMGWVDGDQYVVEKVQKLEEIASRGVLATPGVAVDGVLKSSGKVPSHSMVQEWLEE
jgi:small redox-active disulfide protein 2